MPGRTAGCRAMGARSAQRVLIGASGPVEIAQRRHAQEAGRTGFAPGGLDRAPESALTARLGSLTASRESLTSWPVTVHAPDGTPYTQVVIDTGPVPGTIPSIVSSWVNVSPDRGVLWAPIRRPVKRTVTEYGSPTVSPELNQCVATNACGSVESAPAALLGPGRVTPWTSGEFRVAGLGAATPSRDFERFVTRRRAIPELSFPCVVPSSAVPVKPARWAPAGQVRPVGTRRSCTTWA